jgi:hypothetical protein
VGAPPEVIPLFPLSEVLLPAMPLPLRIFEPRYHQLLADVFGDHVAPVEGAGFGVLALRSGVEAGTAEEVPDIETVGTFAEILEVEAEPGGTQRVLAVGSRRFRVCRLLPHLRPYLSAEVIWLDEQEGDIDTTTLEIVRHLSERISQAITALTGQVSELTPLRDPTMLSYQVAANVPLATADRQALLAAPTTAERLHLAVRLLGREIRLLQSTRSIAMAPSVLRLAAEPN